MKRRKLTVKSGGDRDSAPITCLPCSAGLLAYLTFFAAVLPSSQSVHRGLSLYGSKKVAFSSFHLSGENEKPCFRPSSALQKRWPACERQSQLRVRSDKEKLRTSDVSGWSKPSV